MQSFQAQTEEAETLLYYAKKCIPKIGNSIANGKQSLSIFQKLAEIRKEEISSAFSLADPVIEQNHIKLTDSKLIEKLVKRERINTLIFNLYPANKGYTLSVINRVNDNREETVNSMRLPYTEEQLFSYIDNEEIPPLLCNMIDNCLVRLYYNGCVVAEIRDYRKSANLTHCVKYHVLLHQSLQTIVHDVNEAIIVNMTSENKLQAKLEIEKTLLLANYGPLCLNPKPSLAIANQKLHYSKYFLNTHKLKYKARKHTLLGIAQKKKQEQYTKCLPSISNIIEFISKKKVSKLQKLRIPKKVMPECPASDDFWTEAARTVLELAKPIERPIDTNQTIFNSRLVEEYVIETRSESRLQFIIKLTISQRNSDYEYIGEVQQSRELSTGGFHSISYSFPLGTHELATRYVLEFTNVYTERGKIRVNFTHRVPGEQPEAFVTSGLRMEGNKLVPIESKSLGHDTMVSWQTFSDNKTKNVINLPKVRSQPSEKTNVTMSVATAPVKHVQLPSSENTNQLPLIRDHQQLQMRIQQQLQQQIMQQKRQQQNVQLQQEMKAITNFKAQIQEHLQMRQTNVINGMLPQSGSQYTSLLNKKENSITASSVNQISGNTQRTITAVLPKQANIMPYQTTNNDVPQDTVSISSTHNMNASVVNGNASSGNNSTILSLLANTSAQSSPSSSSAAANITLSNLLSSSATVTNVAASRNVNAVNVGGCQRVVAKRLKMQNAATTAALTRVIPSGQQPTASLANATVIAATNNTITTNANINAQPLIRLSLSSLTNQTTPVIQQRGSKNITSRILTPANIKTATLVNSITPVNVSSTVAGGGFQIGNNVHNITAVQSLLTTAGVVAVTTSPLTVTTSGTSAGNVRMKANNRRITTATGTTAVVVGGIQSLATPPASNGQMASEMSSIVAAATPAATPTINCTKIQTVNVTSSAPTSCAHLSSGELQTLAGTLTAAPTIGTIQLTRNMQTLPAASVHLVTSNNNNNSNNLQTINSTIKGGIASSATMNSIQLSAGSNMADGLVTKGQKIMRLSSAASATVSNAMVTTSAADNQETMSQTSVGLPMSALSALLSGAPISTDGTISGTARIGATNASTSQSVSAGNAPTINLAGASNANVGMQNVQVSIPGVAVPITLSLNVGDQSGNSYLDALSPNAVTTLSNVVGTSVILANSTGSNIKTSTLRPVVSAATVANVHGGTVQQLQLIGSVQRNKIGTQTPKPMTARSLLNTNRVKVTIPPPNAVVHQFPGGQNQELSVTAQQQLQLAFQKQAAQLQLHQAAGGLKVAQKRRRSSVATDGS